MMQKYNLTDILGQEYEQWLDSIEPLLPLPTLKEEAYAERETIKSETDLSKIGSTGADKRGETP